MIIQGVRKLFCQNKRSDNTHQDDDHFFGRRGKRVNIDLLNQK